MHIIEDTLQQKGKHDLKHKHFEESGVELIRCRLPFGDYVMPPERSVDTKKDMDEIANNLCGAEHVRFKNECIKARDAGCKLFILVENKLGIKTIDDVHLWSNPRSVYSQNCVQGDRLEKAMKTMRERYGVQFLFCDPSEAAERIVEILRGDWDAVCKFI